MSPQIGIPTVWQPTRSENVAVTPLIRKRGDPSRRRDDDYDVLEDGKVVGRIFKVPVAPKDRPWGASGHGGHVERAAHGYAKTREAAMAAFAKSWRRE
jgi:hypothetical protein